MGSHSAIVMDGLVFRYASGQAPALLNATAEIPASSVTAILGPNGCGKTTLLHLMLGLIHHQAGNLWIQGTEAGQLSRRARSLRMGLVPQHEQVPFEFSLLEYILLGRAPHLGLLEQPGPNDRAIAEEALAGVGLEPFKHRSILSLSGGERQLAMIARALVQQPSILLMDEPSAHLDLINRRVMRRAIKDLASSHITIVFTTHDPSLLHELADHILLMRAGRIMASGPPEKTLKADLLGLTYNLPLSVVQAEIGHILSP